MCAAGYMVTRFFVALFLTSPICADADCDLFLKILHQEESEDLYHDEIQEMDDVLYLALETDRKEHGGKATGKCSKEGFLVAVRQRFLKSFEEVGDQLFLFCIVWTLRLASDVNVAGPQHGRHLLWTCTCCESLGRWEGRTSCIGPDALYSDTKAGRLWS